MATNLSVTFKHVHGGNREFKNINTILIKHYFHACFKSRQGSHTFETQKERKEKTETK